MDLVFIDSSRNEFRLRDPAFLAVLYEKKIRFRQGFSLTDVDRSIRLIHLPYAYDGRVRRSAVTHAMHEATLDDAALCDSCPRWSVQSTNAARNQQTAETRSTRFALYPRNYTTQDEGRSTLSGLKNAPKRNIMAKLSRRQPCSRNTMNTGALYGITDYRNCRRIHLDRCVRH